MSSEAIYVVCDSGTSDTKLVCWYPDYGSARVKADVLNAPNPDLCLHHVLRVWRGEELLKTLGQLSAGWWLDGVIWRKSMGPIDIEVDPHASRTERYVYRWGRRDLHGVLQAMALGHDRDGGVELEQCKADAIAAVEAWRDQIR